VFIVTSTADDLFCGQPLDALRHEKGRGPPLAVVIVEAVRKGGAGTAPLRAALQAHGVHQHGQVGRGCDP